MTALALEICGVTAGYGETTVLWDVSFAVGTGEVLALLGPNGTGKTTALRAATGIIRPSSGRVRLTGDDVTGLRPHRRTALGLCLIPEGRGVFRSMTVQENLRLQRSAGESRPTDAIDRAMAVFPALKHRLKDMAGRLSGGQQQMLALARAYVTDPKVILLDEVSMGLAPKVVEEVFQALEGLANAGVAMVLVEQYVTRALALADHVVLLDKGTVSYDGKPDGLDEEAVLRGYLGIGLADA
jgi:branched-chain amino acid transport system ATP-binding protein